MYKFIKWVMSWYFYKATNKTINSETKNFNWNELIFNYCTDLCDVIQLILFNWVIIYF